MFQTGVSTVAATVVSDPLPFRVRTNTRATCGAEISSAHGSLRNLTCICSNNQWPSTRRHRSTWVPPWKVFCPSVVIFGNHMYHRHCARSPLTSMMGLATPWRIHSTDEFDSMKLVDRVAAGVASKIVAIPHAISVQTDLLPRAVVEWLRLQPHSGGHRDLANVVQVSGSSQIADISLGQSAGARRRSSEFPNSPRKSDREWRLEVGKIRHRKTGVIEPIIVEKGMRLRLQRQYLVPVGLRPILCEVIDRLGADVYTQP